MGKLKETEQQILDEWRRFAELRKDAEEFSEDGLLWRGEIYFADGAWHRKEGDEEERWLHAPRRLLILTKDLNDTEAWNIRQETGRQNKAVFSYQHGVPYIKNLRMWSYGLLQTTADAAPDFQTARNMEITGPFFETAPIAHVNCKKQCGGSSISNALLSSYLNTYSEFLKQQIAVYNADVLLCCGCAKDTNLILDFVRSQYLTDLQVVPSTGEWIYYSPSTDKWVINSYHPSARIGYEENYEGMMHAFRLALATQTKDSDQKGCIGGMTTETK